MTFPDHLVPASWERVETHISWVFLGPDQVYKIKKPVDFGFLDFTTVEARRQACQAEVDLNRRLAPDVYLGLLPVTRGPGGALQIGGEGDAVDWVVHMRRLPDTDRADVRLTQGRLTGDHLATVASVLAQFHRASPVVHPVDPVQVVRRNVEENFDQTRATIRNHLSVEEVRELETRQLSFLAAHASRLEARAEAGFVREGHGDLRLEHVYMDERGRVRILDCIEFNRRFREGDTASDLAFLSMDLAFHGRMDLSEQLLALVARDANDYDLYGVVDFYESYRAHVRAKIASFVASDPKLDARARDQARHMARRYYRLSIAAQRTDLVSPRLVAVGGPIASGKSTLADRLARRMGAPVVETDRTRKYLAGVDPTTSIEDGAFGGVYSADVTRRVYSEVLRRAAVVLRSGRSVVVDATFRERVFRDQARELAKNLGVPFRFVECEVPVEVLRERLARRDRDTTISDGRAEILNDFLARWEPVVELDPATHRRVDTTIPVERNLKQLDPWLPGWPVGPSP